MEREAAKHARRAEVAAWYAEGGCPPDASRSAREALCLLGDDKRGPDESARWVVIASTGGAPRLAACVPAGGVEHIVSKEGVDESWRQACDRAEAKGDAQPLHPYLPIRIAWSARRVLALDTRRDTAVIPHVAGGDRPDGAQADEASFIPAWWPHVKAIPLLDIVDAAGLPIAASGTSAPVISRLFLAVLSNVKLGVRSQASGELSMTVGQLRDAVFPNGWRRYRDWPRLRGALLRANSYFIVHPGSGGNGWTAPIVVVQSMVRAAVSLDDRITMRVTYPPGEHSGPIVSRPELERLIVDGPRWRACIGVQTLAWRPGTTRVRYGKKQTWGWSAKPGAYHVLTASDRRRIAFGTSAHHYTSARIDAVFEKLPGIRVVSTDAKDAVTGERGWLVLPEPAAQIIKGARHSR